MDYTRVQGGKAISLAWCSGCLNFRRRRRRFMARLGKDYRWDHETFGEMRMPAPFHLFNVAFSLSVFEYHARDWVKAIDHCAGRDRCSRRAIFFIYITEQCRFVLSIHLCIVCLVHWDIFWRFVELRWAFAWVWRYTVVLSESFTSYPYIYLYIPSFHKNINFILIYFKLIYHFIFIFIFLKKIMYWKTLQKSSGSHISTIF